MSSVDVERYVELMNLIGVEGDFLQPAEGIELKKLYEEILDEEKHRA